MLAEVAGWRVPPGYLAELIARAWRTGVMMAAAPPAFLKAATLQAPRPDESRRRGHHGLNWSGRKGATPEESRSRCSVRPVTEGGRRKSACETRQAAATASKQMPGKARQPAAGGLRREAPDAWLSPGRARSAMRTTLKAVELLGAELGIPAGRSPGRPGAGRLDRPPGLGGQGPSRAILPTATLERAAHGRAGGHGDAWRMFRGGLDESFQEAARRTAVNFLAGGGAEQAKRSSQDRTCHFDLRRPSRATMDGSALRGYPGVARIAKRGKPMNR